MSRSLAVVGFALGVLGLLAAQDPADKDKKGGPDPKEAIKQMKTLLDDKKMEKDDEAVKVLDQKLLTPFADFSDKDKSEVVKAIGGVFKIRQRPPEKKQVYTAAAFALGKIASEGHKDASKVLVDAHDNDSFKKPDWRALRADILKNVGKAKDPARVDFLLERARRDVEDVIMAAAGEALGNYDGAPQDVRKRIVKEMLIKYGEVTGGAKKNLDPGDAQVATHKNTLAAISEPWNTTLAKLTGQSHREAGEWQAWWNKNKDEDWDKGKPKK